MQQLQQPVLTHMFITGKNRDMASKQPLWTKHLFHATLCHTLFVLPPPARVPLASSMCTALLTQVR